MGQLELLENEHLRLPHFCQMVSDRAANDATADDDDVRALLHDDCLPSPRSAAPGWRPDPRDERNRERCMGTATGSTGASLHTV